MVSLRRVQEVVRRAPLGLRFGVLSAVIMAVVTVALLLRIQSLIEDRAIDRAARATEFTALVAIEPVLTGHGVAGAPLSRRLSTELDAVVRSGFERGVLRRIKVFNRSSRLVYSDDAAQVGQVHADSDALRRALAGERTTQLASVVDRDHAGERGLGVLLEVYVPLQLDGDDRVDAVVEAYVPYAPVSDAVRHDSRQLLLVLLAGFGLLWVSLLRVVNVVSRRLQRELARNRHQALHDALTGLPNRTLLFDRVEQALVSDRRHGTATAVLLLDLDGFKEVNDTLGHHNGDILLVEVARRFTAALRTSDSLVRLGGDEFAVLLPRVGGAVSARQTAYRLLASLDEPVVLDGAPVTMTASVGIALAPAHGDRPELLLQRADVAMYAAKAGHEPVEVYTPEQDTHSGERLALLGDLRRALAGDELLLHFQPKSEVSSGSVIGVEALVRWQHPTRGLVAPDEFIPLAEQTGMIRDVTEWVLRRALETASAWGTAGTELALSVNISARDLADVAFPDLVVALLADSGFPHDRLTLEITETSLMTDPVMALRVLRSLEARGIRLSIDDYGSGYSSLAYVQQLPVDELKIDRSLLRRLAVDERNRAIVRSTIELGHSLGLRVVAEGVEDAATWEVLAELDCDQLQGYHLSRPLPSDLVVAWLRDREQARTPAAGALVASSPSPPPARPVPTTSTTTAAAARTR